MEIFYMKRVIISKLGDRGGRPRTRGSAPQYYESQPSQRAFSRRYELLQHLRLNRSRSRRWHQDFQCARNRDWTPGPGPPAREAGVSRDASASEEGGETSG